MPKPLTNNDEQLEAIVEPALKEAIAYGFDKGYANDHKPDHEKANAFRDELVAAIAAHIEVERLKAARDELHNFIAGGRNIYESSSYSIDGTQLSARLAEINAALKAAGGNHE